MPREADRFEHRLLEAAASAGVHSVLKRPGERHVAERAYEQPKFVEDIVRDLTLGIDAFDGIRSHRLSSENSSRSTATTPAP